MSELIFSTYTVLAVIGGSVFGIQLALMLIGIQHDIEFEAEDIGDSDSAFQYLSLSAISSFCLMFGLLGMTAIEDFGLSAGFSLLPALFGGLLSAFIVKLSLNLMKKLNHEGADVGLEQYIGFHGIVSIATDFSGGMVLLKNGSGSSELPAVSKDGTIIPRNLSITVIEVIGNKLVVEAT